MMSETKMKGKGEREREFGPVLGSVFGGRGREGVGMILSDVMKKNVKEWREVSSRITWVMVQLGVEKCIHVNFILLMSKRQREGGVISLIAKSKMRTETTM